MEHKILFDRSAGTKYTTWTVCSLIATFEDWDHRPETLSGRQPSIYQRYLRRMGESLLVLRLLELLSSSLGSEWNIQHHWIQL